ncbi:MAG: hypothetical protein HKN42_01530 [Granulosicoccus sp.]|nr:hypothetical protein [Granulosicoccus sp.]
MSARTGALAESPDSTPTESSRNPAQSPAMQGSSTAMAVTPAAPVSTGKQSAANDAGTHDHSSNLIKRTVDEICALMADVHEIREELLAHGVQFHMLNALIELGVHDKPDEQATMIDTAVEASVKAHGPQAIKREELESHLSAIVTLEKDLRHVRHVASQQGVHMQALNHLTQLMRLNPGDGGVQAINTFVAYADAAGVPLDRLDDIRAQFRDGPKSVLPDIAREDEADNSGYLIELGQNILAGLALTAMVMWMVL